MPEMQTVINESAAMNRIREERFGLKRGIGILLLCIILTGPVMAQTEETSENQSDQASVQNGVRNNNSPSAAQSNSGEIQNRLRAQAMVFEWTRQNNPNQFQPGINGVTPSRLLSERQIRKNAERMALEYTRNRSLQTDAINSQSRIPGAPEVAGQTQEDLRRAARMMAYDSTAGRNPWGGTETKLANTRRTGEQVRGTALSQTAVSASNMEQELLEARLNRMQEVKKQRNSYEQAVKKDFESFQRTRLKPLKYNGISRNFSGFNQTFRPIARR